ncbi:hypothetical protein ACFIN9_26585 [Streptomyces noursei]|uniref:hypothetical protein n=1 Tax=Streptomyces noursei TaxID=1971 RepID=UPI0036D27B71
MRHIVTGKGELVVIMKAGEIVIAGAALMAYVADHPDSNLAIRMGEDLDRIVMDLDEHAQREATPQS